VAFADASPEVTLPYLSQDRRAWRALGEKAAAVPKSLISAVDPNREPVRSFRIAMPTGEGLSRIRFSKNVVNRRFVDDALIYRIA